jgi:uncharacterized coiled-coil protein SlyX
MSIIEIVGVFILAMASALGVAIIYDRLHNHDKMAREDRLEVELAQMHARISDQEKRLADQDNQIQLLHRLLGEAQLRINYLETESTYHQRRASELQDRLLGKQQGG